jgi:hypothetical protein
MPHWTLQLDVPRQSRVQPPFGQAIVQALVPVQLSVDPVPSVMLQVLPPPHVTVLFAPVWSVHLLVPSHVDVQFELQLPWQVDCPAHEVVQPVPQTDVHVFFVLQS